MATQDPAPSVNSAAQLNHAPELDLFRYHNLRARTSGQDLMIEVSICVNDSAQQAATSAEQAIAVAELIRTALTRDVRNVLDVAVQLSAPPTRGLHRHVQSGLQHAHGDGYTHGHAHGANEQIVESVAHAATQSDSHSHGEGQAEHSHSHGDGDGDGEHSHSHGGPPKPSA